MAQPRPRADGGAAGALASVGDGRFELSGDVGFADAGRLLAEGDAAFRGLGAVDVDLARVARVDSAGLALLLEWSVAARQGRPVVHLAARFGGAGFLPHRFRSGKAAPARQPAAT